MDDGHRRGPPSARTPGSRHRFSFPFPCRLHVAVHPDPASLELHLRIGGPEFRKLAPLIDLRSIEVYGEPGGAVLDQPSQKARMLGANGSDVVHQLHAGFARSLAADR